MRPTPPEDSPRYVRHDEREIDRWEASGMRYRLLERGGSYRLEAWELYRWVTVEPDRQALARRLAELVRIEKVNSKVLSMERRQV